MAYMYNPGKEILHRRLPGKKIYHQGFEEKIFLTKPNHPYDPLKDKWSAP